MFISLLFIAAVARYYLKQRDGVDALLKQLREDVVADFKSASGTAYTAGVNTRAFYDENAPKVVDAYNRLASAVSDRFVRN